MAPMPQTSNAQRRSSWLIWALLAIVLLGTLIIRWRLRECPLERDEGEYAYIGQLLLKGEAPYGATGNHKFPGAYLAYAAMMALFGQSASGIHIGFLGVNLACTALLFFLGRRLGGNAAGLAAAAAWAVMSVSPGVLGNAGHLTHLIMLCVLAGLLLVWRGIELESRWRVAAAGVCLGMSVVVRQTSLVFVAFGLVFLWMTMRARESAKANAASETVMFIAGSTFPILAMALWLWFAGVLPEFWRWTFLEAAAYGSQVSLRQGLHQFLGATPKAIGWGCLIWIGAGVGLAIAISKRSRRDWFIIGFLLAGFIAVLPGFYFRGHYYVQLLPAVALLFGIAVARASSMSGLWRYSAVAGALVALVLPLLGRSNYFLAATPVALAREVYGPNPFPEAIEVARYIEANSTPDEPVAVLGSEPEIFFYSRRRSATSLIYSYPLMERHQYAHDMQETMAREIEHKRPKFIVFVNVPTSWSIRDGSDRFIFNWAAAFLSRSYKLDGVADIVAGGSQYVWGAPALAYDLRSAFFIRIYRRVD